MISRQWMDEALCAQTDPEIFFPETGVTYHAANKVCSVCPVRQACVDYAQTIERGLAYSYRHGSWGGTTPRQRAHTDDTDYRRERDARIVRLAAAGWDANGIAEVLNCTTRAVWRALKAHRRSLEEAA